VPVEVVDGDVYKAMLQLIEKLYEGDIDPMVFEEQARFWFGTKAFIIYTIDKVIHGICKQLVQIVTFPRAMKLFHLYSREHQDGQEVRSEIQYRQKADELLDEEENLYRLEFVSQDR
jgi:paired amphipathic helix protein Sin3a